MPISPPWYPAWMQGLAQGVSGAEYQGTSISPNPFRTLISRSDLSSLSQVL